MITEKTTRIKSFRIDGPQILISARTNPMIRARAKATNASSSVCGMYWKADKKTAAKLREIKICAHVFSVFKRLNRQRVFLIDQLETEVEQ